ncbi:MAG: FliM/FliN family flagellar motor C-terminal domain-containing protein [Bryobacterales bacterium]|nr:FliM/FliN family flagellar motor C-terminal domain-containing protein [Bryobacteraceae bacterium]MDW8355262.1 FliM/FliN family flagellar motor C-terminal domain-containing protein [Bryobacterales bacterium]
MEISPQEAIEALGDVPVEIEAELGRPVLTLRDLMGLRPGTVLPLNRPAGENLEVRAGGVLIGYGEVVVVENAAAIRLTDFVVV